MELRIVQVNFVKHPLVQENKLKSKGQKILEELSLVLKYSQKTQYLKKKNLPWPRKVVEAKK